MIGICPGLSGGTKAMRDRVLNTASETVSHSRPKVPSPRWLMMDAALVLRNSFSSFRVANAGCPTIGVMVGWGKPSMSLSEDDML